MIDGHRILAIIPARGGSKRLPNKNILEINKKPLISYTIESAINSKYIDDIIVSSDSDSILNIAKKYKEVTLHRRSDALSIDSASTVDCVLDVIDNFPQYDYVILLQPTSPLRSSVHINESIELARRNSALSVISVCECEHSPLWTNTLDENCTLDHFISPKIAGLRSQDLETYYRINGAIYFLSIEQFCLRKTFFFDNSSYAYKMSRNSSIDIDEEIDFLFTKYIIENNHLN